MCVTCGPNNIHIHACTLFMNCFMPGSLGPGDVRTQHSVFFLAHAPHDSITVAISSDWLICVKLLGIQCLQN